MSAVFAKNNKKGFKAPVLKPQVALTDKEYDDIFSAVLNNIQDGHTNTQLTTEDNLEPEINKPKSKNKIIQGDKNESKKIKKRCNSECDSDSGSLNNKNDLEKNKLTTKEKKLKSQLSPWGSHFHKQPSHVSSTLKEMVELQSSLIGSSAVLSPSSSDDDECNKLHSHIDRLSQMKSLGSSSPPLQADQRSKLQQLQMLRNVGVWVYCCRSSCQKQRYLADITDPQDVPEVWYCHMNPDPKYNSCQCEEQQLSAEEEADMIYNEFTAGSVVWAHVAGYPWWPAMVDDDPDLEQYYWLADDDRTVTFYHVVFFDDSSVTRAWVNLKNISPYVKYENKYKQRNARGINFSHRIKLAKEQANDAITLTTAQRLNIYSFIARYKGPIITSENQIKTTVKKYKLKVNVNKKEARQSSKGKKVKKVEEMAIQIKGRPQLSDCKKNSKPAKRKKVNQSDLTECVVGKQECNDNDTRIKNYNNTLVPKSLVDSPLELQSKDHMLIFPDEPAKSMSTPVNSERNRSVNKLCESDNKLNNYTNGETSQRSGDNEFFENKLKSSDNVNNIPVSTDGKETNTILSTVEQSQICEMEDVSQNGTPSQSNTIADIFNSENGDAIVPEGNISDQSQPFEE